MRFDRVEEWRIRRGEMASETGESFGAFRIPGPKGAMMFIIASSGDPSIGVEWEHASVHVENRCPNWPEMDFIKNLFWDDEECVMQLHPPRSRWINLHPYTLHLWRPWKSAGEIPLPPQKAV